MTSLFSQRLKESIEGNSLNLSRTSDMGGMRINHALSEDVYEIIDKTLKVPDKQRISQVISNLSGVRSRAWPSQQAIEVTVYDLVKDFYREPVKISLEMIMNILKETVIDCARDVLDGYPILKEEILSCMTGKLTKVVKHFKSTHSIQNVLVLMLAKSEIPIPCIFC